MQGELLETLPTNLSQKVLHDAAMLEMVLMCTNRIKQHQSANLVQNSGLPLLCVGRQAGSHWWDVTFREFLELPQVTYIAHNYAAHAIHVPYGYQAMSSRPRGIQDQSQASGVPMLSNEIAPKKNGMLMRSLWEYSEN
jgi:hypothetical protein